MTEQEQKKLRQILGLLNTTRDLLVVDLRPYFPPRTIVDENLNALAAGIRKVMETHT